jgi:hypothetical protein
MTLYRFAGDAFKGQANGEGIQSFGRTWQWPPPRRRAARPHPAPAPTTTDPS